jgi:hypothetical protein
LALEGVEKNWGKSVFGKLLLASVAGFGHHAASGAHQWAQARFRAHSAAYARRLAAAAAAARRAGPGWAAVSTTGWALPTEAESK